MIFINLAAVSYNGTTCINTEGRLADNVHRHASR